VGIPTAGFFETLRTERDDSPRKDRGLVGTGKPPDGQSLNDFAARPTMTPDRARVWSVAPFEPCAAQRRTVG
jgi:hypothetical protein